MVNISKMVYSQTNESEAKKLNLRNHECNKFIAFRNDYIDDLPSNILKPCDENYLMYKCRTNFFTVVSLGISILIRTEIL